jgi:hypothetical protein
MDKYEINIKDVYTTTIKSPLKVLKAIKRENEKIRQTGRTNNF